MVTSFRLLRLDTSSIERSGSAAYQYSGMGDHPPNSQLRPAGGPGRRPSAIPGIRNCSRISVHRAGTAGPQRRFRTRSGRLRPHGQAACSGRMVRLHGQGRVVRQCGQAAWSGCIVRPHGHRGRFGLDRGRPPVVMHPPGFDTAPAIGSAPGCPTISPTPGSRSARPHSTTEKETCCDGYP